MIDTRRVVLLHGIWMPGASMAWMAARLRDAGLECVNFAYYGARHGLEGTSPRLIEALSHGPTHVLAHSLGGLIALATLRQNPQLPVQRVVCLASPLRGSGAARGLLQRTWTAATLGRAAGLLEHGLDRWDGQAQVGMIAGNVARGLGQLFGRFEGEHDGTVAVSETRLPGLTDHVTVAASHSGIVFSAEAARLAVAFFQHGRFSP